MKLNRQNSYRFWSKVNKNGVQTIYIDTPCWEWTASCNQDGYGHFVLYGRLTRAVHISYELVHGEIPDRMELDHLCHNPKCVNPNHLEAVTHQENVRRGNELRGPRLLCPNGHLIAGDNEYIYPKSGKRCCRLCQNERSRLWQENHKCRSL